MAADARIAIVDWRMIADHRCLASLLFSIVSQLCIEVASAVNVRPRAASGAPRRAPLL
jgi:hypothetical protein